METKTVEELLRAIMELSYCGGGPVDAPFFHFSCDMYYNYLDDGPFTVKLHHIEHKDNGKLPNIHFRRDNFLDSLLDAYNHLKLLS
jgi:hypothetical protein